MLFLLILLLTVFAPNFAMFSKLNKCAQLATVGMFKKRQNTLCPALSFCSYREIEISIELLREQRDDFQELAERTRVEHKQIEEKIKDLTTETIQCHDGSLARVLKEEFKNNEALERMYLNHTIRECVNEVYLLEDKISDKTEMFEKLMLLQQKNEKKNKNECIDNVHEKIIDPTEVS